MARVFKMRLDEDEGFEGIRCEKLLSFNAVSFRIIEWSSGVQTQCHAPRYALNPLGPC
jgi:hypothetical protein